MGAERQYVVFRLEGQHYGAAIDVVREVKNVEPVTHLPNTPPYVDGVVSLRGEVLPVVNLRKRLSLPEREPDKDTRFMILSLAERSAAVIVDGVEQVQLVDEAAIVAPDQQTTIPGQDYVVGVAKVGERLIVIMDLARLMAPA
ncbi:MAG: chemotaxis protein CheW [Mycobacterium leprae]